ncbi:MAG: hypothetical protein KF729_38380, partial [Sandaracinaceae bacterium]|nr:hypothetical protein [Sandaracinaceae bacterium]
EAPAAAPPAPRPLLTQVVQRLGAEVDTLVGLARLERRADDAPLGPNPFGPPTAELDLSPYLRRIPVDVPPRVLGAVVVAIAFVLGSGLAVAAIDRDGPIHAHKYDAKPPAFEATPEPEVSVSPRLTELMRDDADDADDAPSVWPSLRSEAPSVATRAGGASRDGAIEALRERRQARRRARIRARWRAARGS